MVDSVVLAKKIAAVRDAIERIRAVLPADHDVFLRDRTTREVVVLNLFVALQECLSMATHWLSDAGWDVPQSYRDIFLSLADHGVMNQDLALRLASASGLRNLVAHQYGALDWTRIHEMAATRLDDLLAFASTLAAKCEKSEGG
ncbi:MAG: DUF86 domain-containing protein [Vicinamibacteria bacterium]|nr:DUF86 domain-containing protein [Vicinamibacteria bacterium]